MLQVCVEAQQKLTLVSLISFSLSLWGLFHKAGVVQLMDACWRAKGGWLESGVGGAENKPDNLVDTLARSECILYR